RFDLFNCIDIPCVLLRAGLAIVLVNSETGSENLVTMALIHLAITVFQGTGMAIAAFAVSPGLRLGLRHVRRSTARHLFGFSLWMFLLSIGTVISGQMGRFLVGSVLRIGLVTPFNAAARLVGYVKNILLTTTGVLTPVATAWY